MVTAAAWNKGGGISNFSLMLKVIIHTFKYLSLYTESERKFSTYNKKKEG
jgi:hypothetical protein